MFNNRFFFKVRLFNNRLRLSLIKFSLNSQLICSQRTLLMHKAPKIPRPPLIMVSFFLLAPMLLMTSWKWVGQWQGISWWNWTWQGIWVISIRSSFYLLSPWLPLVIWMDRNKRAFDGIESISSGVRDFVSEPLFFC